MSSKLGVIQSSSSNIQSYIRFSNPKISSNLQCIFVNISFAIILTKKKRY